MQLYKEENLQFVSHLLVKEDDYAIDHTTKAAIHELVSSGNVEELCCDSLLIVGSGCTCSKDMGVEGDTLGGWTQ